MRLYFDTTEWIYHFEGSGEFGAAATALIERTNLGGHTTISSLFILSEILVIPRRNQNEFVMARLRRFFLSTSITLAPYPLQAVDLYSELRAISRVKSLDALHLAIAATARVDYFVTNDTKLHKLVVPGIRRICKSGAVEL